MRRVHWQVLRRYALVPDEFVFGRRPIFEVMAILLAP
jgi:hypothetical protein